jgi:hypothetical protein
MRLFLLTMAVTLLMAHNIVPHHHHEEALVEHHHDGDQHEEEDDGDEGLGYLFSNVIHNPASEKVIHVLSSFPAKDTKKKIGSELAIMQSFTAIVISEWPPDLAALSRPAKVLSSPISISLLRAPPVI